MTGWLAAYVVAAIVLIGFIEWLDPQHRHDFD